MTLLDVFIEFIQIYGRTHNFRYFTRLCGSIQENTATVLLNGRDIIIDVQHKIYIY